MKIISKFKDYYDYLQGVNGIDTLVVLDRTEFSTKPFEPAENTIVRFFICGYQVEGLYKNGKFLFGKEIEEFTCDEKFYTYDDDQENYYYLKGKSKYYYDSKVLREPKLLSKSPNDILNCPILIQDVFGKCKITDSYNSTIKYSKFPILREYDLAKVFPPDKIWLLLYNWLSKEVIIEDKQTDKEKIVSKGFDLKHSFRNTK